ncbi:MAG: F0F1 ATP synthase subunit A [Planctomycetota bacterium]|jgi:F-type H+-transporting ATPase subunit a
MTSAVETEQHLEATAQHAETAAAHGEETIDVGGHILHHILDSDKLELGLPVDALQPALPRIELFGVDISITKHVVMMWLVGAFLLVVFGLAARRTSERVPRGLRNALEILIVFIRDEVARKSIGPGADRFVGYLLTTFFFILICNLAGLIPGMTTATANISVTAALALIAFAVIQYGGIREHGVMKHIKNLVPHGLPVWLIPVMFVLEVLSMLIKPFALCIRLFANMMAGHVAILAFISLIFILSSLYSGIVGVAVSPFVVAFELFVHLLEILVATLQAYIFTMLTANFIGMTMHPSH